MIRLLKLTSKLWPCLSACTSRAHRNNQLAEAAVALWQRAAAASQSFLFALHSDTQPAAGIAAMLPPTLPERRTLPRGSRCSPSRAEPSREASLEKPAAAATYLCAALTAEGRRRRTRSRRRRRSGRWDESSR